jgi:hypothetical protein
VVALYVLYLVKFHLSFASLRKIDGLSIELMGAKTVQARRSHFCTNMHLV